MEIQKIYPDPVLDISHSSHGQTFFTKLKKSTNLNLTYESSTELDSQKHLKPPPEEDSYKVKFHMKQCLAGLCVHVLYYLFSPLFILGMRWLFGKYLVFNMGFGLNKYFKLELIIWVWIYYSGMIWYYMNYRIEEFYGLIFGVGIVVGLRNFMVAIKYGYFPRYTWQDMKSRYYTDDEIAQNLLIKSWFNIPSKIIDKEIRAAFSRRNADETKMCILFHGEVPKYLKQAHYEHLTQCPLHPAGVCIHLEVVARYFVEKVNEKAAHSRILIMVMCVSVVYIITPYYMRIYEFGIEVYSPDPFEVIYYIISMPIGIINCYAFLTFLGLGVIDFRRRKMLMAICSAAIDKHYEDKLNLEQAKFDMRDKLTVESWYILRSCFLDFGRRYTHRIFLYASLILPVCILVIILILLEMINVIGTEFNIYFIYPIILTMFCTFIITYIISCGVHLYDMFYLHKDMLLHLIEELPSTIPELESAKSAWKQTKKTLKSKMVMLDHDSVLRPVRIMGFRITSEVYSKMLAMVVSGIFAIFQVMFL